LLYVAMTRPENYLYLIGGLEVTRKESKTHTWTKELKPVLEQMAERKEAHYEKVAWKDLKPHNAEANQPEKTPLQDEQLALLNPLPAYGVHSIRCFSASALQKYLYCPRRYFYQEVERLPEYMGEEADEKKICNNRSPVILGALIHRALELYEIDTAETSEQMAGTCGGAKEHAEYLKLLWESVAYEAADKIKNIGAHRKEFMKLPDMLSRYISSKTFSSLLPKFRKRELYFGQLELKSSDGKSFSFNGVIDAVLDNGDGTVDLIDYKTGSVPNADEINEGYAWQLFIYKLAAETKFGFKVRKASLHYLQGTLGDEGEPYIWNLPCGCNSISEDNLLKICAEILELKHERQYTRNEKHCSGCSYKYLCRKS